LDWLRKTPIVSLIIAAAMVAVTFLAATEPGPNVTRFEEARDEAREFLVRNPQLAVDSLGTMILESDWLDEARAAAVASDSSADVALPTRMLARSQAKLDGFIENAYAERLNSDPAWRHGVLDARTPPENYFAHAFVNASIMGAVLCVAVLLLVGAPLERSWGTPIFALFSFVAIPLAAQGYRLLDASSGVPWSGSAGLAGALLGAYFIRGLGGHFLVPGWLLLPVWLGVETFVVREFWLDDLGSVPWASLCACVGFGALVAGGLRLIGVESALDARAAKAQRSGIHPIIARAARLRSDGDPHQGFELLEAGWRDHPADREVAEAFFAMAVEVGQPQTAADAILPSLNEALRSGDTARALEYWLPLVSGEADVTLEATAAVRLGEACLDAGRPEHAIDALRRALRSDVSSSQAVRIVRVARDLDVPLTREAARIALDDPRLDPAHRAELEPILARVVDESEAASARIGQEVTPKAAGSRESEAAANVAAPEAIPASLAFASDASSIAASETPSTEHESKLQTQNLDPSALSAEALGAEVSADRSTASKGASEAGDVLSHWNDVTRVDAAASPPDFDDDITEEGEVDLSGESMPQSMPNAALPEGFDARDDETDTDMTPLMEASEELTSPFEPRAPADELTMLATKPAPSVRVASTEPVEDSPTVARPPSAPPAPDEAFAIGLESRKPRLRTLRAVDAVPIMQHEGWIEIEADGRGKSKLPIARIEAIIVAGISGLASRPVLLVDFALNWSQHTSEPLKIIRFRSDRFDPRTFESEQSQPIEALTAWVRRLQLASSATCLPSRAILEGRFARYASIEEYESEVLAAMRET
jgi:membrane associated rhomboid family serine protease